jgi:hypothetical protein
MLAEAAAATTDRTSILDALHRASAVTGSDFSYLLSTATRESGLKPQAQSSTSSAAGLFQFVEQTWLGLVKEHGAKYGLASFANEIGRDADGRFHADNAADRQAILALRKDPQVSALMAGEFAKQTRTTLESTLGRNVCGGELYAAHFLGPDAACRLIQTSASQPNASAAQEFPQAASANRNVFYHPDGTAKTVREVYDWALGQPGQTAPMPQDSASVSATSASFVTAATPDAQTQALMSDLMSWTPRSGFFQNGDNPGSLPTAPFLLTPGVMDVLSSASAPVAPDRSTS